MGIETIKAEILDVSRQGADWGTKVSLGCASLLCVAFLVGFVIKKL